MKRTVLVIAMALLVCATWVRADEGVRKGGGKTVRLENLGLVTPGSEAPWLAGWKADGNPTNIARQVDGRKALALVFFATWCKPCRKGLELLAVNRARLEGAGVGILLVDLMEDKDVVAAYMTTMNIAHWPVIIDSRGQVCKDYGIVAATGAQDGSASASLPRTVVVDSGRKVLALFGEEGDDYVDAIIAAAKGEVR